MPKTIAVHSFRGGTGKSNSVANLASLLALDGYRVGIIDTDIQSPGVHVLFGLDEERVELSLNDYLWGECAVEEAAYDVTSTLGDECPGRLFLIPSSINTQEIARILRESYDPDLLNEGFQDLIDELNLDFLVIDTHPGLNEETLLSIAISDVLVLILRPDSQDYQGTGVTVEVARKLGVKRMLLVVNKTPAAFDFADVHAKVENAYHAPVAVVLPHSDKFMELASEGIFSVRYPDHPLTTLYRRLANKLAE